MTLDTPPTYMTKDVLAAVLQEFAWPAARARHRDQLGEGEEEGEEGEEDEEGEEEDRSEAAKGGVPLPGSVRAGRGPRPASWGRRWRR